MSEQTIVVLGSFAADVTFRASRLPVWGETLMGSGFLLGPGGKGSNQAVVAARAGGSVRLMSRLGRDAFGAMARKLWAEAAIDTSLVSEADVPTGAAAILVDDQRGENAILIVPGACYTLTAEDVTHEATAFAQAKVVLVQLELPLRTVEQGLRLAKDAGVTTILNPAPAPAEGLHDSFLALADVVIPNESEAAILSGLSVAGVNDAIAAARELQSRGARHVIVTLGEQGALLCEEGKMPAHVPAFSAGPCVETTGAGDAFCGAFAAGLAEGMAMVGAVRFGCAAAAISVTCAGAAPSMPERHEIEALVQANSKA